MGKHTPSRPLCTFATSCWENDWRTILLSAEYLAKLQIAHHRYPFAERLLIINNVLDLPFVKRVAEDLLRQGVLTRYVVVDEIVGEMLPFFHLSRSDFRLSANAAEYGTSHPNWIYYNALGPLAAIYSCGSDYLLYMTGDVRLERPVRWIEKAIRMMEKRPEAKVANLVWNERYDEAKRESYGKTWNFFLAKKGFSDQMFLVKTADFRAPIYGEIRGDSDHFPRGDVFEKRVFSYMLNRGWERIIYRRGSYLHKNIS